MAGWRGSCWTAAAAAVTLPGLALLAICALASPAAGDNSTCAARARCVPPVQCPRVMMRAHRARITVCALPTGATGVLCPVKHHGLTHHSSGRALLRSAPPVQVWLAAAAAERGLARLQRTEAHAQALDARNSAAFAHFHSVMPLQPLQLSPEGSPAAHDHRAALRSVLTAQELARRRGWGLREHYRPLLEDEEDDDDVEHEAQLKDGERRAEHEGPACPESPTCCKRDALFRRADGACNNEFRPRWGAADTAHSRVLPPRYHDGVWEPRRSVMGGPLPNPRTISTSIFPDRDAPHEYASLLVMLFGQIVSHDILLTPSIQLRNGSGVMCCTADEARVLPAERLHFACMPITVPPRDYFYARFGKRCINMVRSQLALRDDCELGPAAQLNKVTHFVDASVLYGSTKEVADRLRAHRGGRLRAHFEWGREFPPLSTDPPTCAPVRPPRPCYFTGDVRANQMIGLVAMGRLLLRQHNALADALAVINPHWDDERLYQEARRIVGAQLQHVLYNEWLPVVIGRMAMTDYRLWPLEEGYSDEYDPRTDPTTSLEFATAAFRYGHSTVDGIIKLFHQGFGFEHVFQPEIVFNPSRLRNPEFSDQFFVAMTHQPMQRADNFVSQTMTNYLFNGDRPFGIDLIAINIQRGIDHGMPTYDDMRVLQGLPHAHSFEDFEDRIPAEGIHLLEQIYASPQDVDFYVGGLLERPAYDSVVGPSFQGVIADQFSRLKKGDRFYYEFGNLPNSFTPAQLQELRKTRFARILCDFRDGVALHHVSPHPFLLPSVPGNQPIDCNSLPLPQIDLWTWKEM